MATAPIMHADPPQWINPGGMNINPTGANGTGGVTPAWGANPPRSIDPHGSPVVGPMAPPTGSPGNYGYGASANPNPTGPTSTPFPTGQPVTNPFNMETGPGGGYSGNQASFGNELGKIYGKGVGSELYSFLNTGAGYSGPLTQQAVEAQAAEMQRQAMTGYGNLESGMGGAGISPNSSVAALESSNYWSNVTTAENAMTAQEYFTMWNDSMNRETQILGDIIPGAQKYKSEQPGLMDFLSSGLSFFEGNMSLAGAAFGV